MPATVKEVAKLAGVSTATVSRVLNRTDLVTNETRNRVLSSIEVLGYVQNRYAVELSRSKRLKPNRNLEIRSYIPALELQKADTQSDRKIRELMTEKLRLLAIKCGTLGLLIDEVIQDVKCIT